MRKPCVAVLVNGDGAEYEPGFCRYDATKPEVQRLEGRSHLLEALREQRLAKPCCYEISMLLGVYSVQQHPMKGSCLYVIWFLSMFIVNLEVLPVFPPVGYCSVGCCWTLHCINRRGVSCVYLPN